jgi:hypothetical protein
VHFLTPRPARDDFITSRNWSRQHRYHVYTIIFRLISADSLHGFNYDTA